MKHIAKHSFHARYLSHPVRVRGLKHRAQPDISS